MKMYSIILLKSFETFMDGIDREYVVVWIYGIFWSNFVIIVIIY
jgi:hypothetical protein